MIAKAVKGREFRGALAYDLGNDNGRILDTNMAGESLRELSAEFGSDPSLPTSKNPKRSYGRYK